jgi:hypothetical protein
MRRWERSGGISGGLVYLHSLIANVAHLTFYCNTPLRPDRWGVPYCLLHSWLAGYARVLRYDPALGARHYVSKYVVKRLAEWELFGFPAVPQLAPTQGWGWVCPSGVQPVSIPTGPVQYSIVLYYISAPFPFPLGQISLYGML